MSHFPSYVRAEWLLWVVSELQEARGKPCSTKDIEEATGWTERELKPFLTQLLNNSSLAGCTCGMCNGDFAISGTGRKTMKERPALKDSKPTDKPKTIQQEETLF
ncbi:hypothetical protein SEA_KEELAN_131 [Gordonia phage Keelan]|nr:hypothetical protein SEA_KEELAN_131 [Gordonia phage Keelan]